jgi:hypothetical protein
MTEFSRIDLQSDDYKFDLVCVGESQITGTRPFGRKTGLFQVVLG